MIRCYVSDNKTECLLQKCKSLFCNLYGELLLTGIKHVTRNILSEYSKFIDLISLCIFSLAFNYFSWMSWLLDCYCQNNQYNTKKEAN